MLVIQQCVTPLLRVALRDLRLRNLSADAVLDASVPEPRECEHHAQADEAQRAADTGGAAGVAFTGCVRGPLTTPLAERTW